jgi:hypothetical protein
MLTIGLSCDKVGHPNLVGPIWVVRSQILSFSGQEVLGLKMTRGI